MVRNALGQDMVAQPVQVPKDIVEKMQAAIGKGCAVIPDQLPAPTMEPGQEAPTAI